MKQRGYLSTNSAQFSNPPSPQNFSDDPLQISMPITPRTNVLQGHENHGFSVNAAAQSLENTIEGSIAMEIPSVSLRTMTDYRADVRPRN